MSFPTGRGAAGTSQGKPSQAIACHDCWSPCSRKGHAMCQNSREGRREQPKRCGISTEIEAVSDSFGVRSSLLPVIGYLSLTSCMQHGLVHVSAGDLLRAEVQAGTEAGQKAKRYMDEGNLVPNEVVVEMVVSRLQHEDAQTKGWLLDGYPRSAEQAQAIEAAGIRPDAFILINVSCCTSFHCLHTMHGF